jgi:hypothetical protein
MKKNMLQVLSKTLVVSSFAALVFSAVNSSIASAQPSSGITSRCLRWEISFIDAKVVNIGSCQFVRPELKTTYRSYNRSNESLSVEYWDGGYERILTRDVRYQYDLVKLCGRNRGMIERSFEKTKLDYQKLLFGFSNPNLDENLRYSFLKSPLTQAEMEAELPGLYSKCKAYGFTSR